MFYCHAVAGKQDNVASRSVLVSHIGMSSIGISIQQLLAHEDASIVEIKYFQRELPNPYPNSIY